MFATTLVLALLTVFSYFTAQVRSQGRKDEGIQRYVTRKDIEAPRWRVKVHDEKAVTPGYWFVSPYEKVGETTPGGGWIGPHIFDGNGELVWSGSHMFNNINIMDFKVSTVRGKDMLSMIFAKEGNALLLDHHYQITEAIPIGNTGSTLNMHDIRYVDNGSRALILNRNFTRATKEMSKVVGFNGMCQVIFHGFEEMDTTTWQHTFSWSAYDHVPLDDSTMTNAPIQGRCNNWWDYIHANAIDKFADGHYLLSARHTDTIYKISKENGSIIWRLGGPKTDFEMVSNLNFSRQHHVRFHEQNDTHTIISLLDNAMGQDDQKPTSEYSRALLIALRTDTQPMVAEIIAHFDHPHGGYAFRRGDYQILDNGNAFVCWSEQALQTEHTPDGKTVMEAELVSKFLGTYRSFKYPFVGRPLDPPDVYSAAFNAEKEKGKTTTLVHVSWNGATEVATWSLYKTTEDGKTKVRLASRARDGFETALTYDGFASYVLLEALDSHGEVLGQSNVVKTVQPADMSSPAVAEEVQWLEEMTETQGHPWKEQARSLLFNPLFTFVVGLVCSAFIVLILWRLRNRRISWHSAYFPMRAGDAEDYDETKLDDMHGHRRKPSEGDEFELDTDEDEMGLPSSAETSQSGSGTPAGRTPFLRQKSGV